MNVFLSKIFRRQGSLVAAVFIAGALFGLSAFWVFEGRPSDATEVREYGSYTYINPLLACENLENVSDQSLNRLKADLDELIVKKKADRTIASASIYFRDLNNGPWRGIGEKDTFTPGSLLKVPLLMAFYKEAETNSSIFEQKFLYEKGIANIPQIIVPANEVTPSHVYSSRELLESMIIHSDNNAALLLFGILGEKKVAQTYTDLGILPPADGSDYFVSVRSYASFFRVLYNATYLTRRASEEVLRLMSKVRFMEGLVAGVPKDVSVAHKFGERIFAADNLKQLHDCGIVYFPKHPYILCVMTRGYDIPVLATFIRDVSKIAYKAVDSEF